MEKKPGFRVWRKVDKRVYIGTQPAQGIRAQESSKKKKKKGIQVGWELSGQHREADPTLGEKRYP